MPKLKSALSAHQVHSAKKASQNRAADARKAKEASVKASKAGLKKAKKSTSDTSPTPDKGKAKTARHTIPFDKEDTILLLGEANFSFALSLLEHHQVQPLSLCATSYDSEEVCYEKYADAREIVKVLREKGVSVGFGVDAGDLEGKGGREVLGKGKAREKRWSRVIFNFPHVGESPFAIVSE